VRVSKVVDGRRVVYDDEDEFMEEARHNRRVNQSAGMKSDSFCMLALYADAQKLIRDIALVTGENENQVVESALRLYARKVSDGNG
jgi:hypothetical protein